MTGKERVAAIFRHEPTDRVPIYMGSMSAKVASTVLGREALVGGGAARYKEACAVWEGEEAHQQYLEQAKQDAIDLAVALDLDYVRPSYWRMPTKPTKRLDEYTFLYGDPDGSWRVLSYDAERELFSEVDASPQPVLTYADLERYVERAERSAESSSKPAPSSFFNLENAIAQVGDTRAVQGGGVGISIPWYNSYGNELWLEAAIERPDLIERLLDTQVIRAGKCIAVHAELGVPYLHGGGDFASKDGPVYSPRIFHDLMLPRLQKVSEMCRQHGCYHMFASDGDLWPVADDLFGRSGVEGYYEIDNDCGMDLRLLRQRFPHLTLLGGISSATLHRGSVEDVKKEVMAALEAAKDLGSIMVGCSNMVVPGTPACNFEMMMNLLHTSR